MGTDRAFTKTILFSAATLSLFGCEKMREESPMAVETQPLTTGPLPTSLSSSPDIIVNTTSDAADFGGGQQVGDLPGPDAVVSLREAITAANNTSGPNVIGFNIPTSDAGFDGAVFTIRPNGSPLPALTDDGTTIDGTSQAPFSGETNSSGPEIVLDGSLAGTAEGIEINRSSNNRVLGLVIHSFDHQGIQLSTDPNDPTNNNEIAECFIGTDETGSVAIGNGLRGVTVKGMGNIIKGNLISGNSLTGVGGTANGTRVEGNLIGTDRTGTLALGNSFAGVSLEGVGNIFEGNLISGNAGMGIGIGGSANRVQGNLIGTDRTGTLALGNSTSGINIDGSDHLIGGTTPGVRNIVSGNADQGVVITGNGNRVVANFIGTDITGNVAVGNGMGVSVHGANNRIGGTTPGERNIISGNGPGAEGVGISGDNNQVQGNFIGTDATGTVALGNGGGVTIIGGNNNLIGGTEAGAGNLISGNSAGNGVFIGSIGGGSQNTVQGNRIGTDVTGTIALGNGEDGVRIVSDFGFEADGNRIIGNLISANASYGIGIFASDNNVIQGNLIGTDIAQQPILGNARNGVNIGAGPAGTASTGNRIGGEMSGQGNVIAGNGRAGVRIGDGGSPDQNNVVARNTISHNGRSGIEVSLGVNNDITRNLIFSNADLGIDLERDGVTSNDPGDTDAGANNLMNFPVLTSAEATPGQVVVKGTIDTPNPNTVTLEFFANPVPTPGGDPSGHGEGAIFLGTARPNPQGKFTATVLPVAVGTLISATATDVNGNTSEFAANIAATFP